MSFITAPIASMVGAGLGAFGSLLGGESGSEASQYNAAIQRQNAVIAQQQGQAAVEAQQRNAARTIGTMVANYGASGVQVDSGSPLDVLADSARMAELDKLTTQYNYQLKAMGYQQQASLADMNAKASSTSGLLNAGGSLLKGFGQYKSMMGSPIPGYGNFVDGAATTVSTAEELGSSFAADFAAFAAL